MRGPICSSVLPFWRSARVSRASCRLPASVERNEGTRAPPAAAHAAAGPRQVSPAASALASGQRSTCRLAMNTGPAFRRRLAAARRACCSSRPHAPISSLCSAVHMERLRQAMASVLGVHAHHKLSCAGGAGCALTITAPSSRLTSRCAHRLSCHQRPPATTPACLPGAAPPSDAAECMELAAEIQGQLVKPAAVESDDPGIAVAGWVGGDLWVGGSGGVADAACSAAAAGGHRITSVPGASQPPARATHQGLR